MAYQAKDDLILGQQLKVQEVCVRFSDVGLYTVASNVVTVPIRETVTDVFLVLLKDNSATPVLSALPTASISITGGGQSIACDLGVAFAANDCILIKYATAK